MDDGDKDSGYIMDEAEDKEQEQGDVVAAVNGNQEEEDADLETLASENVILQVGRHVCIARRQRVLMQQVSESAKSSAAAESPHFNRVYTFVINYCQNMELPYFGGNQAGDSYYYTPLTVHCLGMVDVASNNHLYAHIYKEEDGKKVGDNVASLITKTVQHLGLLRDEDPGREPITVFDICPGQNKNNYVLWLVPYLVEGGYFWSVCFTFFIVGHTKNVAEHRFNDLKRQ